MAETTFTAEYSGYAGAFYPSTNYTTTHNHVGDESTAAAGDLWIGQGKSSVTAKFLIRRGFLWFDTSTLPDNCLILSAILNFSPSGSTSKDFYLTVQKGDGTYPHNPIQDSDYEYTHYSGDGGKSYTADVGYASITLNDTGKSWVSRTSWTILALRSSDDIDLIQPNLIDERIKIASHNAAVNSRPQLTVTYYTPTGIPVVGDPTYSNTKATYTKATANISDAGGGYTERGFEYGTSEEATWAVRETGIWGATGDYSLTLPNLLPLTTYYARAFITNEYGTDYSEWTSFTTTDVPSYGVYEEDNTATISFYISEDDGMTWGQKHGPYTTDQIDIEITKLLVRGSGKKKIKFESDVLTGVSASVMVKLDLKAR